jgi:hypothetical protein
MKRMTPFLIAGLAVALAGCTASSTEGNDGHRADIPKARVVGKPVNCLQLQTIRESQVRDDWTIDFRTNGNQWYRNTLPNRCFSLGFERAFAYGTSLTQLCNVDIITVIANTGGPGPINRGACGLGEFTPVELEK